LLPFSAVSRCRFAASSSYHSRARAPTIAAQFLTWRSEHFSSLAISAAVESEATFLPLIFSLAIPAKRLLPPQVFPPNVVVLVSPRLVAAEATFP
jgi:hypothetical protein